MRPPTLSLALILILVVPTLAPILAQAADPFTLNDGDRVVLIGSTVVEREQQTGYWETALLSRFPAANVQVRNLGWSGDTVWGDARAGFGTQADGLKHLKEHVLALKPTVIVVGYGTVESFDGEEALPKFIKGLNELLDAFAPLKARLVFLLPPTMEHNGTPGGDPEEQNNRIYAYGDEIKKVADARNAPFVKLSKSVNSWGKKPAATVNGITPSPYGYWRAVSIVRQDLNIPTPRWRVAIQAGGTVDPSTGTKVSDVSSKAGSLQFRTQDELLPTPPVPADAPQEVTRQSYERVLVVTGLAEGKYRLVIDEQTVAEADAKAWESGVNLEKTPELAQVEKLRATIVEKNRLYFYRWRPQNETYLFGFRKHEQGKNAREIPLFDPLVEEQEAVIAKLRKPATHTYTLSRIPEAR